MHDFSERLKEERKRLGLNQDSFAVLGGVQKLTQFNYEKGIRKPDSDYLAAIAAAGVDVQYLLTGERSRNARLPEDEGELLEGYRLLNEAGRAAIQASLNAYITTGIFTLSGEPAQRVRRLSESRAANLEAHVLEAVKNAQEETAQMQVARATRKKKTT
jgi:transcriptional regulator with XRE-family HTH domain